MFSFENTKLWQDHLAARQGDSFEHSRSRLREAFLKTRENVEPLVNQISKELPALTVHDITHLDALWQVADVIIGKDYPINPAEVFVLGMSFLVHDAATTTHAFKNGINDIINSAEWQDFVTQKEISPEQLRKGEAGYQAALFETLRLLHPVQAEGLLSISWKGDGVDRLLMEDVELRNHYGRHIGKIAASHGKDIALAERSWANAAPVTPHSSLCKNVNPDWNVDCLKIAMILRCVDAAHIDSKRAPDMLRALLQPEGISKLHWDFQGKLGKVSIDQNSELYWSGQDFDQDHADSWWLCYSTIQMIDGELRNANKILENNRRPTFQAQAVRGANDINIFKIDVPTRNWHPVDVSFKATAVNEIIEKFGGKKLYGEKPYLALKELIQNASDAIRAKRLHRETPSHGSIVISLQESNGDWWLSVKDNGIGMSRFILTEVLLDFGRSLWKDNSLRSEWRGLAGKGFEATGQFGIGFFSVFMLGSEIKVTSWRDGDAEDNQSTLHLRDKANSRPLILVTPENDKLKEYGTIVSVKLTNGRESLLPQITSGGIAKRYSGQKREITLSELVGMLAPTIDIDIYTNDSELEKTLTIEADDWLTIDPKVLLKRIAPEYLYSELDDVASTLDNVIENNGGITGRIALDRLADSGFGSGLGALTHNGILVGQSHFPGVLLASNNADLARNSARPICSAEALTSWAERRLEKTHRVSVTDSRLYLSLGVSHTKLPLAFIDRHVSGVGIIEFIEANDLTELVTYNSDPDCPEYIAQEDFDRHFDYHDHIVHTVYGDDDREEFGLGAWLDNLLPASHDAPRTVLSAIDHCISQVWDDYEGYEDYHAIGEVSTKNGSDPIEENCFIFKKVETVDVNDL